MTPVNKIVLALCIWLAVSAGFLFFVMPRLSDSILNTQKKNAAQFTELNLLKEKSHELQTLHTELETIKNQPVQPDDFFTRDVKLVSEIQHEEQIAASTDNKIKIGISGTADKAVKVKSASNLYQVPYTITLQGQFEGVVHFLEMFENSYFVSPVTGLNVSVNTDKATPVVTSNIYANFYIHK